MASIGLETYRVVQDFTAREGDYVIVVNGLCVGVDGSGHLKGAATHVPAPRTPHHVTTQALNGHKGPTSDECMQFIRERITYEETFTAHTLGVSMNLTAGRHVGVSDGIRRLIMVGEVKKVPNGRSHGPYMRVLLNDTSA